MINYRFAFMGYEMRFPAYSEVRRFRLRRELSETELSWSPRDSAETLELGALIVCRKSRVGYRGPKNETVSLFATERRFPCYYFGCLSF
jgi:hypothetical protein